VATSRTDAPPATAPFGPGDWTGSFYSGGWRTGSVPLAVTEPATSLTLAEVAEVGAAEVNAAVSAAAAAQQEWTQTGPVERAQVLYRAAELLQASRDEISTWIVRESGSIRAKAAVEIDGGISELREAAAMATQPNGILLPTTRPGRRSEAHRVPLGVVAVITPWNFPFLLALRSVAPALAVGNAVVLKPDPHTPVCGGLLLAHLFERAGLPVGLLHVLPGGAATGEALVAHSGVAMISFTGSTAVGRAIGAVAGGQLKKVCLELGGNNAYIVLPDADLEAAASSGAWAAFLHQGQICMAASRHLVHKDVVERYAEQLAARAARLPVGDPNREEVALGPIIDERQLEKVDRIVSESIAEGATVVTGGVHDGLFYKPTVLANVKPEMPAFAEEIFGPVAPIIAFDGDDEAIWLANATDYGLVAGIHTGSVERGLRIAEQLHTGIAHVNDQTVNDEAHVPFGGVGASGNGARFGGISNWEAFTEWRWITVAAEQSSYPF
jgi:benzaldehyde dehydrogenase (NAD)